MAKTRKLSEAQRWARWGDKAMRYVARQHAATLQPGEHIVLHDGRSFVVEKVVGDRVYVRGRVRAFDCIWIDWSALRAPVVD